MKKEQIYEIVKIVATAIISVAAVLFLDSCTASMSIFKNNSGSSQNTEQSSTLRTDSTSINIKYK
nr:MAG TPA: hypothetical protein [Microviridae sp.]